MKPRLVNRQTSTLSSTLRGWLPLLQCGLPDLETKLKTHLDINPFVEIKSNHEESIEDDNYEESIEDKDFKSEDYDYYRKDEKSTSITDTIEAMSFVKKSLYDTLYEQVTDKIFPTPISQKIAYKLITFINEDGFFDGDIEDIAQKNSWSKEQVEKIRQRFEYFEPIGIGAKDLRESFIFQLREYDTDEETYQLIVELINNMDELSKFHKRSKFHDAMKIFKKFKNPPAIEFLEESKQIVPDIFIYDDAGELKVELNDEFYPEIVIESYGMDKKDNFVKQKLKEARDLVDALDMRRKTLYKIGLMLVEFQYDFFKGGEIKPMKLVDISEELERNASTISRAISDKYLACNLGVFPLKSFFSVSIDDTSTKAIKDYINKIIKNEPTTKPLSDQKILQLVKDNFNLTMVRRTITKYREQLDIPTSGERKRLYLLKEPV